MKGAITSLPASPSLLSKLWCSIILVRGEDVMGGVSGGRALGSIPEISR